MAREQCIAAYALLHKREYEDALLTVSEISRGTTSAPQLCLGPEWEFAEHFLGRRGW